jgi:transcriptional regulator with XRE-family HTH domain
MKPTRQIRLCVRQLAEARGLTDRELAGRARLDVRVVRRMMNNQEVSRMNLSQLARVADVLDVPTSTLFEDTSAQQSGEHRE